jgi:DNA-binding transcriptional regulator YiaG
MKTSYSTRELADLLSVNESTVKRWADNIADIRGIHQKMTVEGTRR